MLVIVKTALEEQQGPKLSYVEVQGRKKKFQHSLNSHQKHCILFLVDWQFLSLSATQRMKSCTISHLIFFCSLGLFKDSEFSELQAIGLKVL